MEGGDGDNGMPNAWTAEQDEQLRRLVNEYGPVHNWPAIGAAIENQTEVSCRLRWLYQLRPGAENVPFAPEDDAIIVEEHAKHPNDWAAIARRLPGRTENTIKNHWNWELRSRHENPVNVLPPSIRDDSSGSSSVPSGVGSLALELGPVNVIPPGTRNDSASPPNSGSVRPLEVDSGVRSRAPERGCGVHAVGRLFVMSATGRDPDAEDGGREAAEVEQARYRDWFLGIFLWGMIALMVVVLFLALELNQFLV